MNGLLDFLVSDNRYVLVINDQREQEWNISRKELLEFVEIGILAEDEIEQATAMKFNPVSCFFASCSHAKKY